jgi:hypothetical protein
MPVLIYFSSAGKPPFHRMASAPGLCGIGATFDRCHLSGTWRIETILDHISLVSDDSQAEGADKDSSSNCILPGDKIISIDSVNATDLSPQEFAKLIMGPEGSHVSLTLCRTPVSTPPAAEDGAPAAAAAASTAASAGDKAETYVTVVARRSRRTAPFFQPLSASAEGLKAVFRLLGGGGVEEPRTPGGSGGGGSAHGSPVRRDGSPVRRDGGRSGSMVFF